MGLRMILHIPHSCELVHHNGTETHNEILYVHLSKHSKYIKIIDYYRLKIDTVMELKYNTILYLISFTVVRVCSKKGKVY